MRSSTVETSKQTLNYRKRLRWAMLLQPDSLALAGEGAFLTCGSWNLPDKRADSILDSYSGAGVQHRIGGHAGRRLQPPAGWPRAAPVGAAAERRRQLAGLTAGSPRHLRAPAEPHQRRRLRHRRVTLQTSLNSCLVAVISTMPQCSRSVGKEQKGAVICCLSPWKPHKIKTCVHPCLLFTSKRLRPVYSCARNGSLVLSACLPRLRLWAEAVIVRIQGSSWCRRCARAWPS